MFTPNVHELPRRPEAVTLDPFIERDRVTAAKDGSAVGGGADEQLAATGETKDVSAARERTAAVTT